MFKAKKNFSCNSIRKLQGESIDEKEVKLIGDFLNSLIADDIIEEILQDPKPTRKKRNTKKKVI